MRLAAVVLVSNVSFHPKVLPVNIDLQIAELPRSIASQEAIAELPRSTVYECGAREYMGQRKLLIQERASAASAKEIILKAQFGKGKQNYKSITDHYVFEQDSIASKLKKKLWRIQQ